MSRRSSVSLHPKSYKYGYIFGSSYYETTSPAIGSTSAADWYAAFYCRYSVNSVNNCALGNITFPTGGFWFGISSAQLYSQIVDSVGGLISTGYTPATGHLGREIVALLSYTESDKTPRIYLNGYLVATGTPSGSSYQAHTSFLRIGTRPDVTYDWRTPQQLFSVGGGSISPTASQVLQHYADTLVIGRIAPINAADHTWDLARYSSAPTSISDTSSSPLTMTKSGTVATPIRWP